MKLQYNRLSYKIYDEFEENIFDSEREACFTGITRHIPNVDKIVLRNTDIDELAEYREKVLRRYSKVLNITWDDTTITLHNLKGLSQRTILLQLTLLRPIYDTLIPMPNKPQYNIDLCKALAHKPSNYKKPLNKILDRIKSVPLPSKVYSGHWITDKDHPIKLTKGDRTQILRHNHKGIVLGAFS